MKKALFLYSYNSTVINFQIINKLGKVDHMKYKNYSPLRKVSMLNGRNLLEIGLRKMNSNYNIDQISFTNRMKPYFKNSDIQFNISHASNLVACAITSDDIKLGLDIEYKDLKEIKNISSFFNIDEIDQIKDNPALIIDYWTKKEAILKACNSHIFDMKKIDCTKLNPLYKEEHWIDSKINIDNNYISRIMTNEPIKVMVKEISNPLILPLAV